MSDSLMRVVRQELALYTKLKAEQERTGESWETVANRWNAKVAAHNAKIDQHNAAVKAERTARQAAQEAAANRQAHQAEINSRCGSCFTVHAGECC